MILLCLGIPWYWPADSTLVWMGFPGWVISSIVVSILASIVTAIALHSKAGALDE
ncbi:MAG: hypothetical protein HOK64_06885 [Proteobacteria bacterium]|nr:hypothetical protein [Pseudomonadota bacterium]MBT5064781.1 hypothetical protein [Pseudomonadota bacterium]MBT6194103.1 hypothetical protein [Pseudomonadota bacterium]MBT6465420.1 hypothetical protein [Pseudomonadota bacterium]MBT7561013.1 hypothetical protein [Pseudomonadota bacterium]